MNLKNMLVSVSAALAIGLGSTALAGQTAPLSALDTDADGSISRDEAGADSELMARWEDIDLNGDDKLSAEEYAAVEPTAAGRPPQAAPKAMKQ